MWRVLVPLDGLELSESVIPDAQYLAGPGGTLILVIDAAAFPSPGGEHECPGQASRRYLDSVAAPLEAAGLHVETHVFDLGDPASAIGRAAVELRADIMAVATHALPADQRWQRGSVAWTALMRSVVPVLLRREGTQANGEPTNRSILVPLDGSSLAEAAVPLAQALAVRWQARVWLLRVVENADPEDSIIGAEAYLAMIAEGMMGDVHTVVIPGPAVDTIASQAAALGITHVVMTSHGKTGLTRAIVGSVADELIHRVECPIIVIPPLQTLGETAQQSLLFSEDLVPA